MPLNPPPMPRSLSDIDWIYKKHLFKLYPEFSRLNSQEKLLDLIMDVYPFKLHTTVDPWSKIAGNPRLHPTKKMQRIFGTYMFIMKEYHDLWDL